MGKMIKMTETGFLECIELAKMGFEIEITKSSYDGTPLVLADKDGLTRLFVIERSEEE